MEPPVPVPPVGPVVLPPVLSPADELPPVDVPVAVPVLPLPVEALAPALVLELVWAPVDPPPVVARPVELVSPVVPDVARPVVPPLVSPRVAPLVLPPLVRPPVVSALPVDAELAPVDGPSPWPKQIPAAHVWPLGQSLSELQESLPAGRPCRQPAKPSKAAAAARRRRRCVGTGVLFGFMRRFPG